MRALAFDEILFFSGYNMQQRLSIAYVYNPKKDRFFVWRHFGYILDAIFFTAFFSETASLIVCVAEIKSVVLKWV